MVLSSMAQRLGENGGNGETADETGHLSGWVKTLIEDERGISAFYSANATSELQGKYDAKTVQHIFQSIMTVPDMPGTATYISIPGSLKAFFLQNKEQLKDHFRQHWYRLSFNSLNTQVQDRINNIFLYFGTILEAMEEILEENKTKAAIMVEFETSVEAAGGKMFGFDERKTTVPTPPPLPNGARDTKVEPLDPMPRAIEYARFAFLAFFKEHANQSIISEFNNPGELFERYIYRNSKIPSRFINFIGHCLHLRNNQLKESIAGFCFPDTPYASLTENETKLINDIFSLINSASRGQQTIEWSSPHLYLNTPRPSSRFPKIGGLATVVATGVLAAVGITRDTPIIISADDVTRKPTDASPLRPTSTVAPMAEPTPTIQPPALAHTVEPTQTPVPAPPRTATARELPLPHKRDRHARNAQPQPQNPAGAQQAEVQASCPFALHNIRVLSFNDGVFRIAYSAPAAISSARFVQERNHPIEGGYEITGHIEAICRGKQRRSSQFTTQTGRLIPEITLR